MDNAGAPPYYGDVTDKARRFALAEHADQKHGIMPYSYHLAAVAGLVSCHTNDPEVIAAAWLHDVIEDCESIDKEIVEAMTTKRVAHLVDLLTDLPGARQHSKPRTMMRIMTDPDAAVIKLADRYHNHQSTLLDQSERFARMYYGEFNDFMGFYINANLNDHPLFDLIMYQHAPLGELANGKADNMDGNLSVLRR